MDVCNNSAKVVINYMEKFKLLNTDIHLDLIKKVCTNINFCDFNTFTSCIKERNLGEALGIIYFIYDQGYSVMDILDNTLPLSKLPTCYQKMINIKLFRIFVNT